MNECLRCGFNDEDYGCTCPHSDKWYACPIENKKPENIQALEEETTLSVLEKIIGEIKTERDKYICASGIYQAFNESMKIIEKYRRGE